MSAETPKACYSSICKYVDTLVKALYPDMIVDLPRTAQTDDSNAERVALKISGPRIRLVKPKRYLYTVSLIVITPSTNIYRGQEVVGAIAAQMDNIPVMLDNQQIGCMQLQPDEADMMIFTPGNISPAEPVDRSVITAVYQFEE